MGSLWMLVAGLLFAFMGVLVKLGAVQFSSTELVFYRSLFGLVAIGLIARGQQLSLASPHWRTHLWRGLSGLASLASYFYVLTVLPLATGVTLNYTSPLFLALLTTWILRERLHWPMAVVIATGFAGIVLVLRPTIQHDQLAAGLLGLSSGFFASLAYLNVRALGRLGEPEWRIVFYFTLISTALTGLWLLLRDGFHPVTVAGVPLLLGLGLTATVAQLALTRAYGTGRTLVVGSLSYSTVVFSTILGILFFREILPVPGWVGIGLIVFAGVIAIRAAPQTGP
jgi:drug/metabolite transporter (DMT)-like permease